MDLIKAAAKAQVPLFGVCLGHQAIGQVVRRQGRAGVQAHARKLSPIQHKGQSVFEDVPSPFEGDPLSLPDRRARKLAHGARDHGRDRRHHHGAPPQTLPIHGVQFHPESIASEHGHKILENFLKIAGEHPTQQKKKAA